MKAGIALVRRLPCCKRSLPAAARLRSRWWCRNRRRGRVGFGGKGSGSWRRRSGDRWRRRLRRLRRLRLRRLRLRRFGGRGYGGYGVMATAAGGRLRRLRGYGYGGYGAAATAETSRDIAQALRRAACRASPDHDVPQCRRSAAAAWTPCSRDLRGLGLVLFDDGSTDGSSRLRWATRRDARESSAISRAGTPCVALTRPRPELRRLARRRPPIVRSRIL